MFPILGSNPWLDAHSYKPESCVDVLGFLNPQSYMSEQDVYVLVYLDSEGIWRSRQTHAVVNLICWKFINMWERLKPPYPHYYDRRFGWCQHD